MSDEIIRTLFKGRFDDVSAAVLVVTPEGRVVAVNTEAEDLTGYEREELEGMPLHQIFREEDHQRIQKIFAAPTDLKFRKLFEHNVIIRKRSKRKVMVDMGFRRSEADGHPVFVFTLQDITMLVENERRVARAYRYVDSIINSALEILLVVDGEGAIRTANKAAGSLLEYTDAELIGLPLKNIISGGMKAARAALKATEKEVEFKTKRGRTFPVFLSSAPLEGSLVEGLESRVIVAMDISQRKKDERLIAEQQMMIAHAGKMSALGEMASGIAHEINNPLQVIDGRCDILSMLLDRMEGVDDVKKSVELISRMGNRIERIVKGLQAFSRDRGNDPKELVKLSTILEETLALCEQRIRKKGIRFDIDVLPDVELHCRPTQISQVLLNLLNNAHDAVEASADSWIRLEVRYAEDSEESLEMVVADSGPGVSEEVLEKIFHPFYTTKPPGKGTGLGLSISKSLIEDHGGTLGFVPENGESRFVVRLPGVQKGRKSA